ncbi:YhcN/YlaJ family sporulation lipoprotein [Sediminibacillus halophilus]|uniref:Sporulation lipoprotein YhcN/YlaJ (Spore_YhcN_YlaJ) n=1 Tax=Sediminibacillus halophilus TaxID=482461 RepID=A0A1G9XQQ2_9BACI|nr:YhcN/YlaJ family sporulation lipoprotein [Sediminibacillus halophilus]SDM99088.1 Sporulation lipoprotein YhcN/YlaJ (Spore_YhcN_YlaJ) [Sediminibacillus halophilus]
MNKLLLFVFGCLLFLLAAGCSDQQEEGQMISEDMEDSTMPIDYSTHDEAESKLDDGKNQNGQEEKAQDITGYQENLPPGQQHLEGFYNEQSQSISEDLNKLDEIKLAQVYVSDDRIIVSLTLNQEYDDKAASIADKVYSEVERQAEGKEVLVYNGDIYWNQMRDRDAREPAR